MKRSPLVVFLGPSLDANEARRLAGPEALLLPPAARGDVWRALARRPLVIALIDGVFESSPSVWHHELLAALDGGVAVFGAASMGALRAAELSRFGMRGIGRIYRWYRDGQLLDDSEVALLHADREHGFRPMTVPLVNVRWIAHQARRRHLLSQREANLLVRVAERIFYQERRWPPILRQLEGRWNAETSRCFQSYLDRGPVDLKREDARACLRAAAAQLRSPQRRTEARPSVVLSELALRKLDALTS